MTQLSVYGYYSPIADPATANGITTVGTYLNSLLTKTRPGADLRQDVSCLSADVDGSALLIGENSIEHTPEGEDVQIYLGNAFDLGASVNS